MKFLYKNNGKTTSVIYADYKTETVRVENLSNDHWETAFGKKEHPTWTDYEELLEDRCFPRTRDKMKTHLDLLGLDHYDPLAIVLKTEGRMHGDNFSIELEGDEKE